jgi:hypothetical protein
VAKKRGNGEGTITRRKNGGWMAQYTMYTAEGRKRKTLYGKTRQEVAAKLAKALSDREGGVAFDAGGITSVLTLTGGSPTPSKAPCGKLPTGATRS